MSPKDEEELGHPSQWRILTRSPDGGNKSEETVAGTKAGGQAGSGMREAIVNRETR